MTLRKDTLQHFLSFFSEKLRKSRVTETSPIWLAQETKLIKSEMTCSCGRARIRSDVVCRFPDLKERSPIFQRAEKKFKFLFEPQKLSQSKTHKVACK